MAKRLPAMSNGGIVVTAKRIARYVEPQTTYTAANAAATRARMRWRRTPGWASDKDDQPVKSAFDQPPQFFDIVGSARRR